MDRLTRKELKTDKFAQEVEHSLEYAAEHRQQLIRYGGAALAVVVVAWGIWHYRGTQQAERQSVLAAAVDSHVKPAPQGADAFEAERRKAVESLKRFQEVVDKYPGSEEALIATTYIASIRAEEGNIEEAEKAFKRVIDGGDEATASLARLALAQLYGSTGKPAEAEKLLRVIMDKPTRLVSKEHATIALARILTKTKPEEAKKLIKPLEKDMKGPVAEAVINLSAELR